ncbi:hypothetical protein PIROE2DRAFT_20105 [Piromyces sp. E2]|nr:hypothetical protein PIROE2DRAFT_20105 [Piromyces sp. E2]|eukprot:OUM66976.1 hypothetical protein PIROE2DRAFT_20105 [Piromyces sp. E2]
MVSLSSKLLMFALGKLGSINPIKNPGFVDRVIKGRSKPVKHANKKGYILSIKETENKSRYVVIKKDNNVETKKVVYYLHGGSFVMRSIKMYEEFSYNFCNIRDDVEVYLLDYSLAPEFKYPTQLNEALDVWNEITKTFKPEDIIIGGDSSGGNLSMALIHKLKKEMNIAPRAGFFISSDIDMTFSGESFYTNYRKDIMIGEKNTTLTKEKWEIITHSEALTAVIGDADRKDPYISPLFGDFSSFPKSLFIISNNEMILDDTLRAVEKIKSNGGEVELFVKDGMFHDYPITGSFTPEGKEAINKMKKFILESF